MAASVQFRLQNRDLGMMMREVDEDMVIFLGIRNGEKERNGCVEDPNELDDSTGAEPKPDSLLISKDLEEESVHIVVDDYLLSLDIERNGYDWLTPEKIEVHDSTINQTDASNDDSISSKSEAQHFPSFCGLQLVKSTNSDPPATTNRRPSSFGDRKPASRAATPTGRASLPEKSKPSRASTPTSRTSSMPSRASSYATSTSSKATTMAQVRSSTPSKARLRSSTPAYRPTIPARSKSVSRSAIPTCRPVSTLSSSDGRKIASMNQVPTRGISQIVKPRPSKPSELLSLSQDAPQNPKASMPRRPVSASRGRPAPPVTLSSSCNGKPRQKSCSPAKVRAPNGINGHKIGNLVLSRSRGHGHNGGDDVNPVLMGTKMVERVVNMRKLAPPKRDDGISYDNPKKSSVENSGFGRSLSKRSLDMAIRHMDIRRSISIPDNLRPVATVVSSSLSSGNQSSSSQSSIIGFSESPLTSTSDSSKSSNSCVNSYFLDGRRMDD